MLKTLFVRSFKEMQKSAIKDISAHDHLKRHEDHHCDLDEAFREDDQANMHLNLTEVHNWSYQEAPCMTDIIWHQFCSKYSIYNLIFAFLLNIILFLITILCISPVTFLSNVTFVR